MRQARASRHTSWQAPGTSHASPCTTSITYLHTILLVLLASSFLSDIRHARFCSIFSFFFIFPAFLYIFFQQAPVERDTKHIWLLHVVGQLLAVARSSLDGSQTGAQVHLIHPPPLCLVAIQEKEKGKMKKRLSDRRKAAYEVHQIDCMQCI